MMSLAHRVRDFRYSKGWGPDELANRAQISRTALYQIESGKTGLPRAGTLRRIALALDVTMDDLLGHAEATSHPAARSGHDHPAPGSRGREGGEYIPAEGGPLSLPAHAASHFAGLEEGRSEEARFGIETPRRAATAPFEGLLLRERELMTRLQDLLYSPLGAGIARIIDELHAMLAKNRSLS